MADDNIRMPAVAGGFYPSDPEELKGIIEEFLAKAKDIQIDGKLRALVIPHAGYIYSGPIAAFGYRLLQKHKDEFDKVLILGPSHYAGFLGACEAGFSQWETPLGIVKTISVREKVPDEYRALIHVYPQAHAPEHCLEVQLPFLQIVFGPMKDYTVAPILCGDADPEKLADALFDLVDERTLVIASSDLSHYLPYDQAVKTDSIANQAVPALDIERFERDGDACGKLGILTLMNIAKRKGWKGILLDYRNSGDTSGDRSGVVGYGCYAFYEPSNEKSEKKKKQIGKAKRSERLKDKKE